MLSNHLTLCCPLLLLPPVFPSIRVFCNKASIHIRWPKYWSFSFNIRQCCGSLSFRVDWCGRLAVQGTQESSTEPQIKSIYSSALSYLMAQLSCQYIITGKTVPLKNEHLLEKWYLCLFICSLGLSELFFPRSKCLLISLLQSPSTVILEPRKIKFVTVSIFPQLFAMKWWDQMPWSLFFWMLSF